MLTDISDGELMMLVSEQDENAKNIVFEKYKYIIDVILKKYERIIKKLSIDYKEIYSEALYGFSDALNSFDEKKEASLPTFITLCIERRLNKYFRFYNSKKQQIRLETFSLDYVYDGNGDDYTLSDVISDNHEYDPLTNISRQEAYNELCLKIKNVLSEFEYQVFLDMAYGLNYNEIALILQKEPKQIDNTMQRIKNKIKNIVNK
jgi:RNA polymerase sporulation-specific sigma factor